MLVAGRIETNRLHKVREFVVSIRHSPPLGGSGLLNHLLKSKFMTNQTLTLLLQEDVD
jgi:hypothetical protein